MSEKPFNGSELITYSEASRTFLGKRPTPRGGQEMGPEPIVHSVRARLWTPREITDTYTAQHRESNLRGVTIEAQYEKQQRYVETRDERDYKSITLWVAYAQDIRNRLYKVLIEGYEGHKRGGGTLGSGPDALPAFQRCASDTFGETDTHGVLQLMDETVQQYLAHPGCPENLDDIKKGLVALNKKFSLAECLLTNPSRYGRWATSSPVAAVYY